MILFPSFYSYLTHTQHFSHTSPNLHWRSIGEVLEKHWRTTEGAPKPHKDHTEVTPLSPLRRGRSEIKSSTAFLYHESEIEKPCEKRAVYPLQFYHNIVSSIIFTIFAMRQAFAQAFLTL